MSKIEQKEIKLEIQLPQAGFPKCMYFNRFRVEREDGFCLVQFGLITTSGLVDSYSCIFTKDMLQQNEKTLLDYLNRIGRPAAEKAPAPWKGAVMGAQTEVADIFSMAFRGGTAETCLYVFALTAANRARKSVPGNDTVPGQPLALLRCTADMQKQLIVALYEE